MKKINKKKLLNKDEKIKIREWLHVIVKKVKIKYIVIKKKKNKKKRIIVYKTKTNCLRNCKAGDKGVNK